MYKKKISFFLKLFVKNLFWSIQNVLFYSQFFVSYSEFFDYIKKQNKFF